MDTIGNTKRKNIPFYANTTEFINFVDRVTQGKFGKFTNFTLIESESGFDEYSLSVKDNKILIKATSGSAGGMALNAYLKKYCKFQYGILGVSGNLPDCPPDTKEEISAQTVFHYRYAFNYCTYGYSYAFNDWADWERITDYLILAGYNLVLNPIGNECVWLELLQKFGYTREDAKKYISAPNYLPWQWMMNLSSYNSEYPDYWFVEQQEISRKFNKKLKDFGMSAVLPGYCGAVPDDFLDKHPTAKILPQGYWCEQFLRPAILLPENQIFNEIAKQFYTLQKELLGTDGHHYYSIDPFHEGGKKGGVDLKAYAQSVLKIMRVQDKDAVWALQGWHANPDREILSALSKEDVLIMNLHADERPDGGDDFLGYPHIYCLVNNFGGEVVMRGSAKRTYYKPHEMAKSNDSACVGIGIIPEGVECDEFLFDIIAEVISKQNLREANEYFKEYVGARYGVISEELAKAIEILFEKIYTIDTFMYDHESGLLAKPSLDANRVCFWASPSVIYDLSPLIKVADTLLKYYDECKDREGYVVDAVSIARQLLGDYSWRIIYPMQEAFKNKDKELFNKYRDELLKLFNLQENIIDCDKNLNFQSFLDKALKRGKNEQDKYWIMRSIKRLITLWGDEKCVTLHDYSPREFGDMIRRYYRPRWEKFLGALTESINFNTEFVDYDRFEFDNEFINENKTYSYKVNENLKESLGNVIELVKKGVQDEK